MARTGSLRRGGQDLALILDFCGACAWNTDIRFFTPAAFPYLPDDSFAPGVDRPSMVRGLAILAELARVVPRDSQLARDLMAETMPWSDLERWLARRGVTVSDLEVRQHNRMVTITLAEPL